jgi:hypothetical protein
LQRAFAGNVSGLGAELADLVPQVIREDLPQPCSLVSIPASLESAQGLVRFEQCLLDYAGRIDFAVEPWIKLQPGQKAQILPKSLQSPLLAVRMVTHGISLSTQA